MYGRVLLFRVEPYWDWNKWYDSSCLMNNPFYETKGLRHRDCYLCEDIIQIERNSDLKSNIIADNYIRNEIPLIIGSDVMQNDISKWPISRHNFGLRDLENIYDDNDWKNICLFRSNIKTGDHLTLLRKLQSDYYSQIGWYAHWENCDSKTEKQMRKYYKRPAMIPSMLELSRSNWIVVSQNYTSSTFKLIDPSMGTQIVLMIQISGQNKIRIESKEFCASRGCGVVEDTLHSNEMFVLSARLWKLSYSPIANNGSQLNMAIIIGAVYD